LLSAFQSRLEEKRRETAKSFDDMVSEQIQKVGKDKLLDVKNNLEQTKVYENRLKEVLAEEDSRTIELGRKQLKIQDLQFQLQLDEEMYDTVRRRIRELEMERKRPARVSVAYYADVSNNIDKRAKYSTALFFGALACGMMLAYLRDKADKSLHSPDDVAKRIGMKIIGTTTSSHTIKPVLLSRQIAADFQTIRANLGLLNGGGMPKILAITSPGPQEGKTTFAINLAISLSKSGKKVLLIDGDLRKPDIAHFLNLPNGARGLQDLLFGKNSDQAIYSMPSIGLDVLAADSRNIADAYELIASPLTAQYISFASKNYDHVIIDTPPMLTFPDAMVWAKIADAAILTSFAGHTTAIDLRETKMRLAQINVRLLGTVLNNVRAGHSYYRYGYNYYTQNDKPRKNNRRVNTKLLLPIES
jgi:succinoglycan biosynthesis transport protein ExoP